MDRFDAVFATAFVDCLKDQRGMGKLPPEQEQAFEDFAFAYAEAIARKAREAAARARAKAETGGT